MSLNRRLNTNETFKLIQLYKKHEVLWNTFSQTKGSKDLRLKALKNISKEMNLDVISTKKKLEGLRGNYRKSKKAVEYYKRKGKIFQPIYPWYEELKFLDNRNPKKDLKELDGISDIDLEESEKSDNDFNMEEESVESDIDFTGQEEYVDSETDLFMPEESFFDSLNSTESLVNDDSQNHYKMGFEISTDEEINDITEVNDKLREKQKIISSKPNLNTNFENKSDRQDFEKTKSKNVQTRNKEYAYSENSLNDSYLTNKKELEKYETNTSHEIDEYDAIGIVWAAKLEKLDETQRILAEDLINRIFKKAFFNRLSEETHINLI